MISQKLSKQIEFVKEIDKMKTILRQNWVIGNSKREDDAEHSWHAATLAMIFSEYAKPAVNVDRSIKMLLVHDLVEVYAGDTPCFDSDVVETQAERELKAADKLYSILEEPQGEELKALWLEFDAEETDDARYASAIDHIQPLFLNYYTDGASWKTRTVTREQVYKRNEITKTEIPQLWDFVEMAVEECYEKGFLKG